MHSQWKRQRCQLKTTRNKKKTNVPDRRHACTCESDEERSILVQQFSITTRKGADLERLGCCRPTALETATTVPLGTDPSLQTHLSLARTTTSTTGQAQTWRNPVAVSLHHRKQQQRPHQVQIHTSCREKDTVTVATTSDS